MSGIGGIPEYRNVPVGRQRVRDLADLGGARITSIGDRRASWVGAGAKFQRRIHWRARRRRIRATGYQSPAPIRRWRWCPGSAELRLVFSRRRERRAKIVRPPFTFRPLPEPPRRLSPTRARTPSDPQRMRRMLLMDPTAALASRSPIRPHPLCPPKTSLSAAPLRTTFREI